MRPFVIPLKRDCTVCLPEDRLTFSCTDDMLTVSMRPETPSKLPCAGGACRKSFGPRGVPSGDIAPFDVVSPPRLRLLDGVAGNGVPPMEMTQKASWRYLMMASGTP